MRAWLWTLPVLMGYLACSNGSPGIPLSTPMSYEDPASAGWRLVKDPLSTSDRLVLALMGPEGTFSRGASLTLAVDPEYAEFVPFADGTYVNPTGVYTTTSLGKPDESKSLQIVVGGVVNRQLQAGVFQKDLGEPAKDSGRPLFRIALKAKVGAPAGTPVSFLVLKSVMVPDDLAASDHKPVPIKVGVGTLKTL